MSGARSETSLYAILAQAAGASAIAVPAWAAAAPAAPTGFLAQVQGLIEAGGPVIAILLAISVLALAIILLKIVQFALAHVGSHRFVADVAGQMRAGDFQGAEQALAGQKGPVAAVMRAAAMGRRIGGAENVVREEVERIAQSQLDGLERGLPLLSLIATISPLLGLLGTVTGMIEAFQQLAAAGDRVDPAILSGGIWEALLTTAAGLAIAIPAAAFFMWLQGTVDKAAQRMEDAATQVFTVDLYRAQAQAQGVAQAAE